MVRKNVYIDCDKSPGSILTAFTLYLRLKLTRILITTQKSFWTFLSILKWGMFECNQANKENKSFLTFIALFISNELERIVWKNFRFRWKKYFMMIQYNISRMYNTMKKIVIDFCNLLVHRFHSLQNFKHFNFLHGLFQTAIKLHNKLHETWYVLNTSLPFDPCSFYWNHFRNLLISLSSFGVLYVFWTS